MTEAETTLNRAAVLHPMSTPEGRPAIEIDGALVFAYVNDGRLCVSVDLDTPGPSLAALGDCVPLRVTVQGNTVFSADAAGRVMHHL